jgi:hypothetical protein
MELITDICKKEPYFISGKLYVPMFGKQIDVSIEDKAPIEYAQLCAENLAGLSEVVIDHICQRICDYHQFMLEMWDEDFVEEINQEVPADVQGREILNYIDTPTLYVMDPLGEGIGYSVSGNCPWEPDHGVEFILKDGQLLYVGNTSCLGAWALEKSYKVIF